MPQYIQIFIIVLFLSMVVFNIVMYLKKSNQVIQSSENTIQIPILKTRLFTKTVIPFSTRLNNINPLFIFDKNGIKFKITKEVTQKYWNITEVDWVVFMFSSIFKVHFIDETPSLWVWVPRKKQLITVLEIFQDKKVKLSDKATTLLSNK